MPSKQTSTLGTVLFVFVILSIAIWFVSLVPMIKEGLKKVQGMITTLFQSPFIGLSVFLLLAVAYFSYYYVSPRSLDDDSQKYISQFFNFWALFITLVVVAMALYTSTQRSIPRKVG